MARRRRHPLTFARLLVLGLVLTVIWFAGFLYFLSFLPNQDGASLINKDLETTDAVVVLTGGTLRLDAGLAILDQGSAEKLFVSGVHRGVEVSELLRQSRLNPDRMACCVVLGYEASDTTGNAGETAQWVAEQGVETIRLVTAGYHMPRSLLEFRAAMPEITIVPHPVFPTHVKVEDWYLYSGTAELLFGEYTKSLLAIARLKIHNMLTGMMGKEAE